MRSTWLRRAGPGLIALSAIGILASTTLGAVEGPWVPAACVDGPGGIAPRTAAAPIDPEAAPWFRMDPIVDATGTATGARLAIGRADGDGRRSLTLATESFAAGPFGAIVLAGSDDGARSTVVAVDVVAGCAVTVDTSRDVIRRATLSPDGRSLIQFRVDRRTRADLGVWSTALDGSGRTDRIVEPIDPDARYGRTWSTEFLWSLDGRALAVQSCGEIACRTRVLDRSTGGLRLAAGPDLGAAIGLADGRLVSYLACRGLPCPVVSVDLVSGERRTLARGAGPAALVETADGPRLVHEAWDPFPHLKSADLDGGHVRDLGRLPDGYGLQMAASRSQAGVGAPDAWIVLAPDGRLPADAAGPAPILRHVLDGRSSAIDEVLP